MAAMPTEYQLRASALTLQFGELWQSVAAESARTADPARPSGPQRAARFAYFGRLDLDVVQHVLRFADPISLGALSISCKDMLRFCAQPRREIALWAPHCRRVETRLCVQDPLCKITADAKGAYLRLRLLEIEAELRHFQAQFRLLSSLCQMPKGSVVRLVSNIGYFDNAAIALAVSHHRQYAMSAVILSRSNDAIVFRKTTDYRGPVSFYSQDNVSSLLTPHPSIAMPTIEAKGFIGYAVNLVRLDPDEEYMRYTFLLAAYKNLTLWATEKDLAAARASGALPAIVSARAIDVYTVSRQPGIPTTPRGARTDTLPPVGPVPAAQDEAGPEHEPDARMRPAPEIEDDRPRNPRRAPMCPLMIWLRFGTVGNDRCQCFVSIGRPRRRMLNRDALDAHMMDLRALRDGLLRSIVNSS